MQRPKNRLLIVGDTNSGKKTIKRYVEKKLNDLNLTVDVYDYNSSKYENIAYSRYHGFLVVCDLSDPESIKSVKNWINEIERRVPHRPIILVGNKCDLNISDEKSFSAYYEWTSSNYAYVSAKKGRGLSELFKNVEKLLNEENLNSNCLADSRLTSLKRKILIDARMELSKSEWNQTYFFWKSAPAPIKKLQNLLKIDIANLSEKKVEDLFDSYSKALQTFIEKGRKKSKDKNAEKVMFLLNQLQAAVKAISTPTIDEMSQEKILHIGARALFQQSPLPPELITPIIQLAGQGTDISPEKVKEIVGMESVREHALLNLYYLCVVLKSIYKDVTKEEESTPVNELREIEKEITEEMRKKYGEKRNILQLNSQKTDMLNKYGMAIISKIGNIIPDIDQKLDELHQSNLENTDFGDLLRAFQKAAKPSYRMNH